MNEREKLLGTGNFSRVYRVLDEKTGNCFACKKMESREIAVRELYFLKQMQNPLFPAYKGYYEDADQFCLIMEYICGSSLREFVEKRGPLKENTAVRIAKALALGLLPLHEREAPILYRDLKPENVMIQQDGKTRLVDVGCACYLNDVRRTRAGSPGYAAPEQFSEEGCPGPESDVYGIGRLLYYMLSGGNLTRSEGKRGTAQTQISPGLSGILDRMVCPGQRHRIPDMRTLLTALETWESGQMKPGVYRLLPWRKIHGMGEMFYYEKNIVETVCKERAPQVR